MSPRSCLYFAYGSNLPRRRIEARLGACTLLAVAALPHYELRFHKRGRDGSGKCDAFWTGNGLHRVHGVVYRLDDGQRRTLDRIEGPGYASCDVVVHGNAASYEVYTYVARASAISADVLPFTWYKSLVTEGAREHGLPHEYIAILDAAPARADADRARIEHHSRLVTAGGRVGQSTARPISIDPGAGTKALDNS